LSGAADQLRTELADRYRIERTLGRGGMATVYLAQDLRHNRPVALKVLHLELAATLGPERFQREIRLAARLQHPHILTVHDSGETAGQLWYTMPYVDGESLRQRLIKERQLPVEDALRFTREVADALGYAHDQGIVHRDIKPENILLSRGHALVADFGVARALQKLGGDQLTQTGTSVGTPAYMSPEQAMGDSALDGRSDLYSLGCVLYEMLTGEAPYTGPSAQAITAKRMMDPIPSARRLRETVPVSVDAALQRVLAKAPADRFPSAMAFANALSTSGESERVSTASHPTAAPRRITRAQRVVLAGVAASVLLLVAAAAYFARRPTHASSSRKMLAVLPFKNLGAAADQYFADGLNEEITSRLAALHGLGVISRTSAERYRESSKPLRQIGKELGADYVLEGSVRWEKRSGGTSRIRVTPQLIQVTDDSHLWADRYDADLADVFAVQTQIAEKVTSALGVTLAPSEREVLGSTPTSNLSAYDAYLRGNAANPPDFTVGAERIVNDYRNAVQHYREAVRLDSTFAPAWARLGSALMWLAGFHVEPDQNAPAAEAAISRALALGPELSEAHAASGVYQVIIGKNPTRGLQELERARIARPSDADLLAQIADWEWYMRGPKGRSIPFAERALELDPSSNLKALILARIYRDAGRYDDAERLYDRVIERDPSGSGPYVMRAFVYLLRDGDTTRAKESIRAAAARVDSMALIKSAVSTIGIGTWASLGMLDESFQRALLTLGPSAFGDDTTVYGLVKGYTYRARGRGRESRAYYDSAEVIAEQRRTTLPGDPGPLWVLAWTRAVDGRAPEAYANMERVLKESGFSYFPDEHALVARVALFAGDTTRALTELETRSWSSELTMPWLCVDHFWDPLRANRRFQRLIDGHCPRP
jgi:serine/threonine-protein kinase